MPLPKGSQFAARVKPTSTDMNARSAGATSGASGRIVDSRPVGLFGSVLGLTGLSVAWRLVHQRYGAPMWVADAVAVGAVLDFVVLPIAYALKCITAPDEVRSEFRHPITGNLFATVLVSLLLLPLVITPVSLSTARALWCLGAVGMLIFACAIVNRWMSDRQQIAHATPTWILPVVGLIDIPLAIPSLVMPPMQVPRGVGWTQGQSPKVAAGLKIDKIASGFLYPRQLYVLPNGDVLVVKSNGPGSEAVATPKQLIAGKVKNLSGKGGKGGNRITLLRKKDALSGEWRSTYSSNICTRRLVYS